MQSRRMSLLESCASTAIGYVISVGCNAVQQTGALLFVLAFGMILRWRTRMFLEYRRLTR